MSTSASSWEDRALTKPPSERGEVCCVIAPDKYKTTRLLAQLYLDTQQRTVDGKKLVVKVLFNKEKDAQEFFDKLVPELSGEPNIFGFVDNDSVKLGDANIVLVDRLDTMDAKLKAQLEESAAKQKLSLVVILHEDKKDAIETLQKLRKRFVSME